MIPPAYDWRTDFGRCYDLALETIRRAKIAQGLIRWRSPAEMYLAEAGQS